MDIIRRHLPRELSDDIARRAFKAQTDKRCKGKLEAWVKKVRKERRLMVESFLDLGVEQLDIHDKTDYYAADDTEIEDDEDIEDGTMIRHVYDCYVFVKLIDRLSGDIYTLSIPYMYENQCEQGCTIIHDVYGDAKDAFSRDWDVDQIIHLIFDIGKKCPNIIEDYGAYVDTLEKLLENRGMEIRDYFNLTHHYKLRETEVDTILDNLVIDNVRNLFD